MGSSGLGPVHPVVEGGGRTAVCKGVLGEHHLVHPYARWYASLSLVLGVLDKDQRHHHRPPTPPHLTPGSQVGTIH